MPSTNLLENGKFKSKHQDQVEYGEWRIDHNRSLLILGNENMAWGIRFSPKAYSWFRTQQVSSVQKERERLCVCVCWEGWDGMSVFGGLQVCHRNEILVSTRVVLNGHS